MTTIELKKLSRGRWTYLMKRTVVQQWHLGLLTLKEIVLTLKINRWTFRRWVRWEYYHRVTKYIRAIKMKNTTIEKTLVAKERFFFFSPAKNNTVANEQPVKQAKSST